MTWPDMKAMIQHHSIAVMTSARPHPRPARPAAEADGIIEAKLREIGEMKWLIAELEANPPASSAPVLQPAR